MDANEIIKFPVIKKVLPRTLAQDIVGYNPNNPNDVKKWGEMFKEMYSKIKADFDAKGIPMPTVVIDTLPGPITYAIKTTDEDGNVIHSQF